MANFKLRIQQKKSRVIKFYKIKLKIELFLCWRMRLYVFVKCLMMQFEKILLGKSKLQTNILAELQKSLLQPEREV